MCLCLLKWPFVTIVVGVTEKSPVEHGLVEVVQPNLSVEGGFEPVEPPFEVTGIGAIKAAFYESKKRKDKYADRLLGESSGRDFDNNFYARLVVEPESAARSLLPPGVEPKVTKLPDQNPDEVRDALNKGDSGYKIRGSRIYSSGGNTGTRRRGKGKPRQ